MSRANVSIDGQLLETAKALLQDGESLDQFFDVSIRRAVRKRLVDAEFVARGLAAAERARQTGLYIESDQVIADLEKILQTRVDRS